MNSDGGWWIGYNDKETEGVWKWVRNGGTYANWATYPNDNNGQDCAAVSSFSGNWNDLSCGGERFYICERNY